MSTKGKCDKSVSHSDNLSASRTVVREAQYVDKSSPLPPHHLNCQGRHMLRLHGGILLLEGLICTTNQIINE